MYSLRAAVAASLLLGTIMGWAPTQVSASNNRTDAAAAPRPSSDANAGGVQRGVASYYARRLQGRPTASGEPYDRDKLTAAHRTLPLGTVVRVTDVATRKTVIVEVNDRGPYIPGRTIDLSRRAGEELGITEVGLARVTIEVLSPPAG